MIITLATHLLLAIIVWYFTKNPPKILTNRLAIKQAEDIQKKKRVKKGKKKQKKDGHLQIINYQQINQAKGVSQEESDKEDENYIEYQQPQKVQMQQIESNSPPQSRPNQIQQKAENNRNEILEIVEENGQKKIQRNEQVQTDILNLKKLVNEQIALLRNYFMSQLQEIVPYNGNYGHYKLNIQGSKKSLVAEWKYNSKYPTEIIPIQIKRQHLNPLEISILDRIFQENTDKMLNSQQHFYIFNLVTTIFQELMIAINDTQEDKIQENHSQNQHFLNSQTEIAENFDLKVPHVDSEDLKIKKQIYGKILDEIFYLHDLVEPNNSAMIINQGQEVSNAKRNNARGRYEDEFEQLQLIGEGGFGKVYKVRHKLDGTIYAIKKAVVNYDDFNDRKMLKQVGLLSKLNHPNIVRYYQSWLQDTNSMNELKQDMSFSQNQKSKIDQLNHIYNKWKNQKCDIKFGSSQSNSYSGSIVQNSGIVFAYEDQDSGIVFEDDGQDMSISEGSSISSANNYPKNQSQSSLMEGFKAFPFKILYIAMELCTGINLREFINHHFDEEQHKIQILRGILQGLAYIHSKKIIHRDLKPANIFLTDQNKVKIGDFGLATTEERSINISLQSDQSDFLGDKTKAVGTGYYRAPQQLKSEKYNEKVDIYSLGIIMFELFYKFNTAMERMQTLKELTNSHKLPKEFQGAHAGSDLLQNIQICLQEQADKRPSASKLLEGFRNKYFTQLVSCIANPKHFQFTELLNHLFAIKNQPGANLMRRDAYKGYLTHKITKIYQIHRATHFPTLPLVSVQDFNILNGQKIKTNRNQKYLLLTNRGIVLQYASNCLKAWLVHAREAMRRKKNLNITDQNEAIRRYTFQKTVNWQNDQRKQLQFSEKMITAFDLTYKLEDGFNPVYFCEVIKISESIVYTLSLTQKKPTIYISNSQLYYLLCKKHKIVAQKLYSALLSVKQDFQQMTINKRITYFEQHNIPTNFSKKLCNFLEQTYQTGLDLLFALEVDKQNQIYDQLYYQINSIEKIRKRLVNNPVKWRLAIPPPNCNGFFWEVGILKGLTTVQQYAPGQELCNYHIETQLDHGFDETDVSLWCIGDVLEEQMQKMMLECWKNGLATKWYEWQVGQKQDDRSRHNIIFRRKNERVQVMLRHNQQKKRQNRQDRQSSFISLQQFNMDVIKQMVPNNQIFYY